MKTIWVLERWVDNKWAIQGKSSNGRSIFGYTTKKAADIAILARKDYDAKLRAVKFVKAK